MQCKKKLGFSFICEMRVLVSVCMDEKCGFVFVFIVMDVMPLALLWLYWRFA